MKKTLSVLSIDGGGIRGIIPAILLSEIEKKTGKRISELFDLIAGTSTGGILALGLTRPDEENPTKAKYSAMDLVSLYEKEGVNIFKRSFFHKIRAGGNLFKEKFPQTGVNSVLENYFKEIKLSESLVPVIITAYETERRISWFFKSLKAKNNQEYDFYMKDVARATSAAPTYFSPCKIDVNGQAQYYSFIDGGVYANNPAMCSYVEAKTLYPQAEKINLISLGTGTQSQELKYTKLVNWGLLNWARPVLNVVFDGVETTIDYQLTQIFQNTQSGYYQRFQPRLDGVDEAMDKVSKDNIRSLKLLGERLIRERLKDIENLCELLNN